MKLNVGFSISRFIKDITKGKDIKPTNYIWANVSHSLKTPKKKK